MTYDPNHPSGPTPPPWAGQPGYAPPAPPVPPRKSWFARHKVLTAVLAVVGLFVVLGAIGSAIGPADNGTKEKPAAAAATTTEPDTTKGTALDPNAAPTSAVPPAPEVTVDPTTPDPPAEPELTAGQENALGSAKSYLELSGFSRLGLINQLSSAAGDGYSVADATYAADHVGANWNEQAVRSAKAYLDISNFSRSGLIQQLSSSAGDKYTKAQATYAADKVGL